MFLDINNFKEINDTYGHALGDKCLQLIAKELLQIAGSNSVVSRYGGDEFVILRQIPSTNSRSLVSGNILSLLEHIRLKQQEVRIIDNHSFRTDFAVGWAAYSGCEDIQEALNRADERMYEEKIE